MKKFETEVVGKVGRRLIPFLMLCYFFCFLDRVNIGFAALQMNEDLRFTQSVYGFGAGLAFLTYLVCEAPSNLILVRFGARRWLARIMVTWGILASAMACISTETHFFILRALLGAAEAGFFPGVLFYLTIWFPSYHRARVIALFMACIPLSTVIGAPVSTSLLYLDGLAGLRGWQWMFLLEGLPAVLLGVVTVFYLTERPTDARWLTEHEREQLAQQITAQERRDMAPLSLKQTLISGKVLALGMIASALAALLFGVGFFLPQIVKGFGLTNFQTGIVTMIPSAAGAVSMILWGRRSDRLMERKFHLLAPMVVAAASVAVASLVGDPPIKMACFTLSSMGLFAALPVFWTLAPVFLAGTSVALGFALINSWGALASFLAPWFMGLMRDATGDYRYGLLGLAVFGLCGALIALKFDYGSRVEAPEFGGLTAKVEP